MQRSYRKRKTERTPSGRARNPCLRVHAISPRQYFVCCFSEVYVHDHSCSLLLSPRELALIKKMNTSQFTLETLTKLLEKENLDVLLIEGFHAQVSRRSDIFKVVAAKDENDATNTLEGTSAPILAITGVITTHQRGEACDHQYHPYSQIQLGGPIQKVVEPLQSYARFV